MSNEKLSPNFTLAEMTVTSCRLPNIPTAAEINNLKALCINVLEPVKQYFNKPIIMHSGYRSPGVNAWVGGSESSQHCRGQAADFHVKGHTVLEVALWIRDNIKEYDQLILENFIPRIETSGWVHCSFAKKNRRKTNTKFKGIKTYYNGIISHH